MTGPNLHLDSSVGCFLVGLMLSSIFYGITCTQVAYYVFHYRKDKWFIQTLILLLWLLDTTVTVADIQFIWKLVVTNHASPLTLFPLARGCIVDYIGVALAVIIVQSYYMVTAWRLIANPLYRIPLIGISMILALTSCACSLAAAWIGAPGVSPATFVLTKIPSSMQTISSSLTDVIITVTLVITLRGKRTGFVRTETFITKLIVFVSNRGVLTTILQIAQFITYQSFSDDVLIWFVFHALSGKVYVNSLMAMLNARASVRTAVFGSTSNALPVQDIPLVTIDETSKNTASYSSGETRPSHSHAP